METEAQVPEDRGLHGAPDTVADRFRLRPKMRSPRSVPRTCPRDLSLHGNDNDKNMYSALDIQ